MYRLGEVVIIVVDESLSMMKTDFKPRRIDAVRESLSPFIRSLLERDTHTLVGLVGFYKIAYPIAYPVDDAGLLIEALGDVRVKGEASASGDALNLASLILLASSPPGYERRIILITDDTSNTGIPISLMALPLRSSGIKVDVLILGKPSGKALRDLEKITSFTGGSLVKAEEEGKLLPSLYQFL